MHDLPRGNMDFANLTLRAFEQQATARLGKTFELDHIGQLQMTQGALETGRLRLAIMPTHDSMHRSGKPTEIERFFKKMEHAQILGVRAIFRQWSSGDDQRLGIRLHRPNIAKKIEPVSIGQVDVDDEKVKREFTRQSLRFFERSRYEGLVGRNPLVHQFAKNRREPLAIFQNHNVSFGGSHRVSPWWVSPMGQHRTCINDPRKLWLEVNLASWQEKDSWCPQLSPSPWVRSWVNVPGFSTAQTCSMSAPDLPPPTRFRQNAPPTASNEVADSDHELMRRAGIGEERAFARIVERHHVAVIGTIAKMLGNDAEADDLAQQVFLRVWKSAPRFQPRAKFTTWLFTITRNLVFNEIRRKSRARLVSIDESSQEGAPARELADNRTNAPDRQLAATEVAEAIEQAITALPEQQRMALVLRRYEACSYEEIAEVLETTVSAVKSLLFRARSELKERLADWL